MSAKEIDYLLDKLYSINKYLGGKAFESDFRSRSGSVFKALNNDFAKKFEEVKKIQDARNDRRKETDTSIEILRMNNQIKIGIEFMENVVGKMEKNLALYRGNEALEKDGNDVIFNCKNLLEKLKNIEFYQYEFLAKQEEKKKNRAAMRKTFENKLIDVDVEGLDLEDDTPVPSGGRPRGPKPKKIDKRAAAANDEAMKNMPLTAEEKMALDRWKRMDAEIDGNLDEIEKQLEQLNVQLDDFNKNMERNEVLVEYVTEQAFKLASELQTTNAKLKIILDKINAPGRLCMEITMAVLISALVGMLVYLIRRYMAISSGSG